MSFSKKSPPNHLGDAHQTADGSWTLSHPGHFEWYHSADGAATEARSLYVDASGIASDFADGRSVRVLDVGLGLGYNALVTMDAWLQAGSKGPLEILSLENDEDLFAALCSGEAPWLAGWDPVWLGAVTGLVQVQGSNLEDQACQVWQARVVGPGGGQLKWRVCLGDARSGAAVAQIQAAGPFDYVWQDPFSSRKNPGMWGEDWFAEIAPAVRCGGCLMSYSVASRVRKALAAAGWRVERIPTSTRKKRWLRAFRLAREEDPT